MKECPYTCLIVFLDRILFWKGKISLYKSNADKRQSKHTNKFKQNVHFYSSGPGIINGLPNYKLIYLGIKDPTVIPC